MKLTLALFMLTISSSGFALNYPTDNIRVDSNEFISVLFEEQKNLYQEEAWDRFFANAIFYRYHFLLNKEKSEKYLIEEMVTLEVLGYAKKCQWGEIDLILNGVAEVASDDIQKRMDIIRAKMNLLKVVPLTKKEEKPILEKNDRILWALDTNKIFNVRHPKEIIVKVENKCIY